VDCGVPKFLSPPGYPPYNGAVEARIGSRNTRTGEQAARHGSPEAWTWDDCYAALQEPNRVNRPGRLAALTLQELSQARPPITQRDRLSFLQTLAPSREKIREPHTEDADADLRARPLPTIERNAIIRAPLACGLLQYRRRHVSLLLPRLLPVTDS